VIVIDTSAIAAIFLREPDAFQLYQQIGRAADRVLPSSCIVEFTMLSRYGGDRQAWLAKLIEVNDLEVPPFTREMADIAASTAERYGRGSRHPARLNFGDCLSYAVARHLNAPLLYKGDDFRHTDIESALPA
jgi:ribonuclease VapC